MGLDMYLTAELSVYDCRWDRDKDGNIKKDVHKDRVKEMKTNEKIRKLFPDAPKTDNLNFIRVEFEAGYWRKANQIHNWFVKNVQDGKDDCGRYYVSKEKMQELLNICKQIKNEVKLKTGTVTNGYTYKKDEKTGEMQKVEHLEEGKVIENPEICEELLPSQSGFFFGNTDYNEWYIYAIERTIEILEQALKLPENYTIYYHSSW